MTIQQTIDYGDKIINDCNKRIKNIVKTLDGDLTTMKAVNEELERQKKVLDNVSNDLKDIDYSLKELVNKLEICIKYLLMIN